MRSGGGFGKPEYAGKKKRIGDDVTLMFPPQFAMTSWNGGMCMN